MMDLLQEFGLAYLYTDGYATTGLAMTMWLTLISVVIGFSVSVPLAVGRCSNRRWLRTPIASFTYVLRGTPLFVQLLLIYTGLYSFRLVQETAWLSAIFREGLYCALIAFTLNTAAYTTEIFAGAIRSTNNREIEAARAFGMSEWTVLCRVVLPSALRRSIPAYSNEVVYLLHATSVAFAVTVKDLMAVARDANATTFRSFEAFGIAAVLYLLISFFLLGVFRKAEQRWLNYLRRPAGH